MTASNSDLKSLIEKNLAVQTDGRPASRTPRG